MEVPVPSLPSKTDWKKFFKVLMLVLFVLLILGLIYYFAIRQKVDSTKVKKLISEEAKKYDASKIVEVETILLQGVEEIESSPMLFRQAKTYSKMNNIPIEQVLVDNAIAQAKIYKYIE